MSSRLSPLRKLTWMIPVVTYILGAATMYVRIYPDQVRSSISALPSLITTSQSPPQINKTKIVECLTTHDTWDQKGKCTYAYLASLGPRLTIKDMIKQIDTQRLTDLDYEASCHPIMHSVGNLAFERARTVQEALNTCDQTCSSGCYHGVVQGFFRKEQGTQEHIGEQDFRSKVNEICATPKGSSYPPDVRYQCYHGLGHIMTSTLSYDIQKSTEICDMIPDGSDRESCLGGAYMENATRFIEPGPLPYKKDDPLYPCNTVKQSHKTPCYNNHPDLWETVGLSFPEMFDLCLSTPPEDAKQCVIGVANNISMQWYRGDKQLTKDLCEANAGEYANDCVDIVAKSLYDHDRNSINAFEYCATLSTQDLRVACINGVLSFATTFSSDSIDRLKQDCFKTKLHHSYCDGMKSGSSTPAPK